MTDKNLIYEILSVVEEIPEGKVATYGQIAQLIGRDKNASSKYLRKLWELSVSPCSKPFRTFSTRMDGARGFASPGRRYF